MFHKSNLTFLNANEFHISDQDLCYYCEGEDELQNEGEAYLICHDCSYAKALPLKRKHDNLKAKPKSNKKILILKLCLFISLMNVC